MKPIPIAAAIALATVAGQPLWAEKADMPLERLFKQATHVVVGKVLAVYERKETSGGYHYTRYVAEVKVERARKGDGLAEGSLIYVRYWRRTPVDGRPRPDTAGHRGLPKGGERMEIYLARNAYDGFTDENRDGGLNVLGANGFQPLSEKEAGAEDARKLRQRQGRGTE